MVLELLWVFLLAQLSGFCMIFHIQSFMPAITSTSRWPTFREVGHLPTSLKGGARTSPAPQREVGHLLEGVPWPRTTDKPHDSMFWMIRTASFQVASPLLRANFGLTAGKAAALRMDLNIVSFEIR